MCHFLQINNSHVPEYTTPILIPSPAPSIHRTSIRRNILYDVDYNCFTENINEIHVKCLKHFLTEHFYLFSISDYSALGLYNEVVTNQFNY